MEEQKRCGDDEGSPSSPCIQIEKPVTSDIEKNRGILERRLNQRRSVSELANQGIYPRKYLKKVDRHQPES